MERTKDVSTGMHNLRGGVRANVRVYVVRRGARVYAVLWGVNYSIGPWCCIAHFLDNYSRLGAD